MSTTNLLVVNGLPTYGNWGGPGWSAGVQVPTGTPLTDAQKAVDGINDLDRLFKTHDLAYDEAAKKTDPVAQVQAILAADMQLMGGMWALGPVTDPLAESYRNAAMNVFETKIVWDMLQIGSGWLGQIPFIPSSIPLLFTTAKAFIRPVYRDPLVLDLNNNGLETIGINPANPILFDHNGDGVKTATGWVAPSDGLLVWDRNGNGAIDSGRELFGDATLKSNNQLATDGFDALADLDSNNDGKVDSSDTNFANLRIWRDLNQDGITQAGELTTLAAQNITSFNVAKTANSQTLANGNQIADLGSYTKSDGSQATLGNVTGSLADINLASNPFYSQATGTIPLTAQAQALPDMRGAGRVRSLREAANDGMLEVRRVG